jgi:DNA-binding XRE family transcriptional regulator
MALFGLFGGDPLERALKDIEKKIYEPNWELVVKNAQYLGVENGDMATGSTSAMTMARCINEFSTHYVRTKLTLHPKWTTEGNFKDMSMPLCVSIAMHFRVMFRSTYPLHRRNEVLSMTFGTIKDGPSFKSLIEDMFKNAPLESLADHYPRETNEALDVLETMHKGYSLRSAHEFPHEHFSSFIQTLKNSYL